MTAFKLINAVKHRWIIMRKFLAVAPGIAALPSWFYLGALRSRLLGGCGHRASRNDRKPLDLVVPLGVAKGEEMIIDVLSLAELDVLQEVVVDRIYPFHAIGILPVMILDCGANIGCFASLCRLHFPDAEVHCWEPDAHNFSRLIRQPLLKNGKAQCHEAAVSHVEGEALLSGSGTGGMLDGGKESTPGCRMVRTINLREWLKRHGKSPLIIKMDIEGHEVEVIRSMSGAWRRPCVLFLETHAEMGHDDDLIKSLQVEGFQMSLLREHQLPRDPRVFKEYLATLPE